MPENWKTYKLKEVADLSTGFAFKSKDYSNLGELKVIRGKNITEGYLRWGDDSRYWNNSVEKLDKYIVEEGDIVVGMDGSKIGKNRAIVRSQDLPSILAQRVGRINAKPKIAEQKFLWQLINNKIFEDYINNVKTGTSIPHISLTQIGNLEIKLPSLQEQKSIACILSALDDKIELNLQVNKTLEEMAMALFKHWFVDFGPFQDGEFVESELGEIPKGWEVKELQQLALFKNGKGLKREFFDVNGANNVFGSNGQIGRTNKEMFKKPVIAIGRVGANYGEVHYSVEPCWISDNAVTVQPNNEDDFWWLLQSLRCIDYKNFVGGSAQPLITQGAIKQVKFAVPKTSFLTDYSNKLSLLFNQIENNNSENQTLTQLRDTLLPKLISGEVRVKDVEKTLSEVL